MRFRIRNIFECFFWWLFRRNWLSYHMRTEPLVLRLRDAVEESNVRLSQPFALSAADSEEWDSGPRLKWILPNLVPLYLACFLSGAGLYLLMGLIFGIHNREWRFNMVPAFMTSVIAISLPLVTAFGVFRSRGRWAEEYLFRVTRIGLFTLLTGIGAVISLINFIPLSPDSDSVWALTAHSLLSGGSWGLAVSTLIYLSAIILEIIHCSRSPGYSCAASANMLSERLLNGLLRNSYLTAFLHSHQIHLNQICEPLANINGPSEYMAEFYRIYNDTPMHVIVNKITFIIEKQYLDYHVKGLKALDREVRSFDTCLWLTPHHWLKGINREIRIGFIEPKTESDIRPRSKWFKPRLNICTKFSRNMQEALRNAFLHEMSLRLAEYDIDGYRQHTIAVGKAVMEFSHLWSDIDFRDTFQPQREMADVSSPDREIMFGDIYQWLFLNVQLLEQIVHHEPQVIRTPYVEVMSYIRIHQEYYLSIIDRSVRLGHAEMFGLLLMYIPRFYNIIDLHCRSDNDGADAAMSKGVDGTHGIEHPLTNYRAKWGYIYENPLRYINELPGHLIPGVGWKYLIYLHKHACVWLRKALINKDMELVDKLAEGLAKIMEIDNTWRKIHVKPTDADTLMTRHWIILGETLNNALSSKPEDGYKDILLSLTPVFLRKQAPHVLLRFYSENRQVDMHSPYYDDMLQDISMKINPLDGSGTGSAYMVSTYNEPLRLAFLWLLMTHYRLDDDYPAIDIDIYSQDIANGIDRIINAGGAICKEWLLCDRDSDGTHWISKWLERCARKREARTINEIADAPLDQKKVEMFQKDFIKHFLDNINLAKYFISMRVYRDKEDMELLKATPFVPKRGVIEGEHSTGNTYGEIIGKIYGEAFDIEFEELLSKQVTSATESLKFKPALLKAHDWLEKRGCTPNEGLIISLCRKHVESVFLHDESFVPSWKEAAQVQGFDGRYKGYLIWRGHLIAKNKVIAIDLRKWKPLIVRPMALSDKWASVELRQFTCDEINQLVKKQKESGNQPDPKKIKQDCIAEITVYARYQDPDEECLMIIPIDPDER